MSDGPQRRIIFVMTRWGSSAGGIQTVNRELACAVKRLEPSIDCVAVVTTAGQEEKEDARLRGVTLVDGDSPDDWTGALLSESLAAIPPHEVVAVIGHSHFSGQQALYLRKRFFEHALGIHFVHMSPMDTEALKEYRSLTYISEREKRQKIEVEIASKADVVACIGPRLWRYFHDQLISGFHLKKKSDVIRIDCGLARSEEERTPPLERTVLCLGRTDSLKVKGIDLFARAAGYVARELPKRAAADTAKVALRFVLRGVKDDAEGAALEKRLKELAKEVGGMATINVRPYTTDTEELRSDYRRATAFVMPSREEGFGLVACEALSLGVPVVISSNSGLAEAIDEMAHATAMTTIPCIVSHDTGDDDDIAQRYAEAILKILLDENGSNDYTRLLRERLLQSHSWEAGARQLMQCIGTSRSDRATQSSEATGVTLIQTAADVLRRNHDLLRVPGVVAAGISHAIVVSVQKGMTPPIPKQLEGIDIIVREVETMQPTGTPMPVVSSGDAVMIDGIRRARVGLMVIDRAGSLYATTATHVLPMSGLSKIAIATATGLVECGIARSDRSTDLTLLRLSSSERVGPVVSPAKPPAVRSVEFALPDRNVAGVVSAFEMSMEIGGEVMEDLIEIRITSGEVRAGDSGALVFDPESKRPVGTLVAVAVFGDGGVHAYAATIERGLRALDVQALSIGSLITEPVARTTRAGARIAFLIDPIASPEMLRTLRHVTREQFGSNVYFVGDIGPRGVRAYVHALSQSGNLTAAVAATNMLRDYRIDLMVVVGIAGGLHDVRVGEVVVSSEIVYYEPARITSEGTDPRYRIVGLTPRWLTDKARSLSNTGDLPKIHVGPIASGEKVLTVRGAVEERLGRWGRPLAVEMEGAGVAEAVAASGREVPVVVVRGIGDVLDAPARRTDDQRSAAVQAAIRVATALVSEFAERNASEDILLTT